VGFVGDLHPLLAGVFAPTRDAPFSGRGLAALWRWQLTDDGYLLTVDRHRQVAGEPLVRDASREPGRRVRGIGQITLLPTAWPAEGSSAVRATSASAAASRWDVVLVFHDDSLRYWHYVVTRLQKLQPTSSRLYSVLVDPLGGSIPLVDVTLVFEPFAPLTYGFCGFSVDFVHLATCARQIRQSRWTL
jgi:hypothetical protein